MNGFTARGGWWVLAQVPVTLSSFLLPVNWGAQSFDASHTLQLGGAVLTALGLLLGVAGLVALGRALTPFPKPRDDSRLRQSGVYGWVRHPVYSGHIIAALGWSASWLSLPGVLFGIVVFLFFVQKSAFEERMLSARFPEYAAYARHVRKLLPCLY